MAETRRTRRLSSLIQSALGELLIRKVKDPRLGMISITGVDVSPDMSQAKVYYSLMDQRELDEVQRGFVKAAGYLRRELAHKLRLKTMPRLIPVYDSTLRHGAEMSALIDQVIQDDVARSGEATETDPEDQA